MQRLGYVKKDKDRFQNIFLLQKRLNEWRKKLIILKHEISILEIRRDINKLKL